MEDSIDPSRDASLIADDMRRAVAFVANRRGVAALTRMAFTGEDLGALNDALARRVAIGAAGAGERMDLSVIAQLLGDKDTGLAIQRRALDQQRLFRSPCATTAPRTKLLALAAEVEIGGNAPIEFLLEQSDIELTTLYVVPGSPLPDPMPDHDVAIVIAPMEAIETLALIEQMSAVGAAMLNAPARIRVLERDRLAGQLEGIPGLEMPRTVRLRRANLATLVEADIARLIGAFPIIVRPTGSHAGRGLEKLVVVGDIERYLIDHSESEFFLSRFIDYASADGVYRKYRIVFVDGAPYACHMAISDQWKVWYLNADMDLSAHKREEERRFMSSFEEFGARHDRALAEMATRIGLDYFQVDCAETKAGALLVFEADSTAIVHDMDSPVIYPYKAPQMRRIFQAFARMVTARSHDFKL